MTGLTPSPTGAKPAPLAAIRAARSAGLRYVDDRGPGLRRLRAGRAFRYVDDRGHACPARDVARIRALVIPPAWTHVWICPHPRGHIQATGRDARGRKQYRYHAQWRDVRDTAKFDKLVDFAGALPSVRATVSSWLEDHRATRRRVLATVVRLLELTSIRVGNSAYTRQNGSFGLTTLRENHVHVRGGKIAFRFRGKSGVRRFVELDDPRLARLVRRCQQLPGQELFRYVDDSGRPHRIASSDVNSFLRTVAGVPITAKDFRTWTGTLRAARNLAAMPRPTSTTEAKRSVSAAIKVVAESLGNTPAVCRKCYVHPAVLAAFGDGTLARTMNRPRGASSAPHALSPDERAVVALLTAGAVSRAA